MKSIKMREFVYRLDYTTPLSLLAASALLAVAGCGPPASSQDPPKTQAAQSFHTGTCQAAMIRHGVAHLTALAGSIGLDDNHSFQVRSTVVDEFGVAHLRYDQRYRGVRVWEGEAIVALSAQAVPDSVIHTLGPAFDLSTSPSLDAPEVLRIAHQDLRPQGTYVNDPTIELVIYPMVSEHIRTDRLRGPDGELNAIDVERIPEGYALAYHVHAALENGALETKHTDYIIHAHNGLILKKWSTLYTDAADGSGLSQHSGDVTLVTNILPTGSFELRDDSRSMAIATYDLNHGTMGLGTIFSDPDNTWGDGMNYAAGGPTTDDNGQTAAVDAHYGAEKTFDYYLNVHGRNGIDGSGRATYSRVHYGNYYDNAFWDDNCFCMTYGDGRRYKVLTSVDLTGHEMTHGVTSATAKLTYSGESGGLNEAMSDIFATMIEYYVRGGGGSTIGEMGGNWLIGEQLAASPLRYMYKPSKDRSSRDAWSSTIGAIDPHYSSGPMNRAFYFLSQGASGDSTSDYYSSYLPGGMGGIGNDKAARIAYRALVFKMKASDNYVAARAAFLGAAAELYGATSAESDAVAKAFAAINVGGPGKDTTPPTTMILTPGDGATLSGVRTIGARAEDDVAIKKVEFYLGGTKLATVLTAPYSISWDTTKVTNGTYVLTSKAYDTMGNSARSSEVNITISNSSCVPPEDSRCKSVSGSSTTAEGSDEAAEVRPRADDSGPC